LNYFISFFLLINCITANAQLEYSKWLLEENLYFDFVEYDTIRWTGDYPELRSDIEPMVMVCNSEGDLLFYCTSRRNSQRTIIAYDREFRMMPNGGNLEGHRDGTQGVVAIKSLSNPDQYYIFTMYAQNPNRLNLHYSILDMSLNNGFGDIIENQKNIFLDEGPLTEKMIVVPGICNNYWLIVHELETANFRIYNVDENGVNHSPTIQNIGVVNSTTTRNSINDFGSGEMVVSKNFDKLATMLSSGHLGIFDFNNETGVLSNPVVIETGFRTGYTVCFSPSSQYLYADIDNNIFQYDISFSDVQEIRESKTSIMTQGGTSFSIRIGVDNQLYIKNGGKLYRLSSPNEAFTSSSQLELIYESDPSSIFINPLLYLPEPFYVISTPENILEEDFSVCPNVTVNLNTEDSYDSYIWNTGEVTASIEVNTPSTYWVDVTQGDCTYSDTIVISENSVLLDLGEDIFSCEQTNLIISSRLPNAESYLWSTGETTPSIEVNNSGIYSLEATIGECILRDTIQVTIEEIDSLDIGDMILTCNTDPITLMSNIDGETYNWNTGADTPIIEVTETGSYTLEVQSVEGCIYRDTIDIVFDELSVDLGPDQEICIGDSTILSAPSPETLSSILWSDGSQESYLVVRSSNDYWLAIERGMCLASDTIMINFGMCDTNIDTMMVDTMMVDTTITEVPSVSIPINDCNLYIPNAISFFAEDSRNIDFYVSSNCAFSSIEISIYDRWGNLLAFSTDSFIDRSDVDYQPGVYVAKVEYRFDGVDEVEQVLQSLTVL